MLSTSFTKSLFRYVKVYGKDLLDLVFILDEWLKEERVLPSNQINIWHLARLLIQFALGKAQGMRNIDYNRRDMILTPVFPQMIFSLSDEPDQQIGSGFDIGSLMLEFLRYLGSQSIACASHLNLRVFEDKKIIEPILFKSSQWMPVHHVAYRAFHSIAVSGRFDALHLLTENEDEHISESRDPILVNDSVFMSKNYSDTPVTRHCVLNCLKEWSGVKEIITRENSGRKSELSYVTSVGTVLARQRLARLLLLGGETIRDAINSNTIPVEKNEAEKLKPRDLKDSSANTNSGPKVTTPNEVPKTAGGPAMAPREADDNETINDAKSDWGAVH
ncbi:unnamed protein product [Caenorhabditis bovis]|uniref:DUF7752 domain-containing protein n=1 Tax=Caenorhabditis bovis TaxID=2654633 RepID=A0A8S1EKR6_9PELO|nr:unnamed protein product [Caenorhabditis bovis]